MKYIVASVLLMAALAAGQWLETTMAVGGSPRYLCYNPQSNKLYCRNPVDGSVMIIDGATNQRIGVVGGTGEGSLCYNPTSNVVYCADYWDSALSVIDGATDMVVARPQVSGMPAAFCYAPSAAVLCCALWLSGEVAIVDGVSHSEISVLAAGGGPLGMCFDPGSGRLYCANSWDSTVTVIRGDHGLWSVETTLVVGANPGPLCYDSVDGKAFCGTSDNGVAVIRRDHSVSHVPTGRRSAPAGYNPRGNTMYCTDQESTVTVIDCTSDSVIAAVRVGLQPEAAYFNPLNNKVYCADYGSHDVTVIDAVANAVLVTIAVDSQPCAFAWNPIQNRTYVGCEGGSGGHVDVIRDSIPSGVEESYKPQASSHKLQATVLRDVLVLPRDMTEIRSGISDRVPRPELLDAAGRRVMVLQRGANDVSRLAPGVYFVRDEGRGAGDAGRMRKVLVTR